MYRFQYPNSTRLYRSGSGAGAAFMGTVLSQMPATPRGTTVTVYSPGEVEEELGLTNAMVRRYSNALEAVTGNKVTRVGRGRLYTGEEVEVMKAARALLEDTQTNLSIDQAVRRVLGVDVVTSSVPESMSLFAPIFERLDAQTALIETQTTLIVALQSEMKAVRRELKTLKR